MELLNGFTNGIEKDSSSKDIILLILIGAIIFGFGKNDSLNLFSRNEKNHKHHSGG